MSGPASCGPAFTCRRCGFECHNAKHVDEHDHCNPGKGYGHHNVAIYGAGECLTNPFARRNGVDTTAPRIARATRERHPHMHGSDCDVCRVLEAVATMFPCDEKGLRDRRYECRYCREVFRDIAAASDAMNHDAGCAYGLAKALRAIYT